MAIDVSGGEGGKVRSRAQQPFAPYRHVMVSNLAAIIAGARSAVLGSSPSTQHRQEEFVQLLPGAPGAIVHAGTFMAAAPGIAAQVVRAST